MAKQTSIIESVELESGGEVSINVASNRSDKVSIGFTAGDVDFSFWVTTENAQEIADKINQVLSEAE